MAGESLKGETTLLKVTLDVLNVRASSSTISSFTIKCVVKRGFIRHAKKNNQIEDLLFEVG